MDITWSDVMTVLWILFNSCKRSKFQIKIIETNVFSYCWICPPCSGCLRSPSSGKRENNWGKLPYCDWWRKNSLVSISQTALGYLVMPTQSNCIYVYIYDWALTIYLFYFILLLCHTQWITSRIKTIINRLTNIKFKICALLGRSDCGGEISEKPSLWGIEISPHGQFKY